MRPSLALVHRVSSSTTPAIAVFSALLAGVGVHLAP